MALDAIAGGENSNSYVTVAEADAYFAMRLNSATFDDSGDKEEALLHACLILEQFDYIGIPVRDTFNEDGYTDAPPFQALKWPRLTEGGETIRNYGGSKQVETATIVGTITGSGDASVTVTAEGLAGSPIALSVPVLEGTTQVETATVIGTIEAAGAGDAEVIVTAVGMTGSPKTVQVAVANDDTASDVAGKIRAALIADADIGDVATGFFTVTGAGAEIILTVNTNAANDATLNISIDNGTCAGLTAAPTSANTTPGVAPDNASAVATKIRAALNVDSDITDFFTVGGSEASITLTAKTIAVNDATMNIAYDNDTCTGLTASNTSTDTTEGSLYAVPTPIKNAQCETALWLLQTGSDAGGVSGSESLESVDLGPIKLNYGSTAAGGFASDPTGLPIQAARFLKGLRLLAIAA